MASALFWVALLFVAYTYFIYPLIAAALAAVLARPARRGPCRPAVSVVVAAFNEAERLPARVANLLELDYPPERMQIILVSDGSTDASEQVLGELERNHPGLVALHLPENAGKAVALNRGIELATGELILFADARQRFAPDALLRLAENFADPNVGSVSGELLLTLPDEQGTEVAANVGLYWRYEKWIRRCESAFGSMLGATGAIYAIRRELWRPLPPGTLLDDFLTPMRIVLAGRRAIFDDRAVASDRVSTHSSQEFRRKVRTLAGNYQAVAAEPGLLFPWTNPSTWFQLWSHKLFRLAVPWALVVMLIASLAAPGGFYALAAVGQAAFYGMALAGGWAEQRGIRRVPRLVGLAHTFSVLNLAAACGMLAWVKGRGGPMIWRKAYDSKFVE